MELASLLLGILGILLTLVLSDPAVRALLNLVADYKRRVWSASAYRKGRLESRRHFGYDQWSVRLVVNDDGDTKQHFAARVVNLSQQLVDVLYLPFFSDTGGLTREFMKPWARSGKKVLPVRFDLLDRRQSQGRIAIDHVPPLKPGERRRLEWGLVLPAVFAEGDDYYNWDVEVPYYEMTGEIVFSAQWQVLYARWEIPGVERRPPDLEFDHREIRWKAVLPEPGTRLHLKLGLRKRRNHLEAEKLELPPSLR